jgi:3-hydroxyisobutyrate dehydrogenase/glyoxylate/succinic semialdehyde reductase
MKVGFIGLGIMGSRMAGNLAKHGCELVVFNRTRHKAEALLEQGATWGETPRAVAEGVEFLFTMLAHPDAVEEMALGPRGFPEGTEAGGFLGGLKAGSLWIDCSTVHPSFSRQMAEEARGRQIRFLDAPVAGTKGPAAAGQLTFLVGGEALDLEACRPMLEVMGSRIVHVGGNGQGTSLKMVVNLLLAQGMLAFAEAMVLGQALGINRDRLFEILQGGPVAAPFTASKREKIEGGEYEADFPLRWLHKDLQMACIAAYEQGVALPATSLAKEAYGLAARQGMADLDFSAIYRLLSEEMGVRE